MPPSAAPVSHPAWSGRVKRSTGCIDSYTAYVPPDFEPRYRSIEQALRERISALEPHAPLPSEAQLCAEFGVSRMTARNAVTRLVHEGLVYRQSGRGTFVAPPRTRRRADNLVRFSEELRRQGRQPSSRLVTARTRRASVEEAEQLHLGRNATVVEVCRVRCADTTPVALETAVFPGALAAVLDADLTGGSLHAALITLGRVPSRGHATISAQPATPDDVIHLGVPQRAALLVERRLILDQFDRPLERTETRYAGERYALDVTFDVEDAGR